MAGCKLMKDITKGHCAYDVAGVADLYLINYDRVNTSEVADGELVSFDFGDVADKAHKVEFADNTASFTDELAEGGNGGKYRTHTLNFVIGAEGYQALNESKDALSLGKFVAIIVDRSKKAFMLGRNNGLSATSFNYESGAADADAKGWTVVMAGTEIESAPMIAGDVLKTIIPTASGATIVG